MAKIHQIQLQFVAEQDRGLLRVNTQTQAEFRFWVTRRFVKILWPVLQLIMQTNQQVQSQASSESRQAVVSFQHESALSKSDFQTPYQNQPASMPLGETPVTLALVQLKHSSDGAAILCLHPLQGTGIEIAMNEMLTHSLSKLVSDISATAQWDLELEIAKPSMPVDSGAPRLVN